MVEKEDPSQTEATKQMRSEWFGSHDTHLAIRRVRLDSLNSQVG